MGPRALSVREFDAAGWCWRPLPDCEPDIPVVHDPLKVRLPLGRGKGVEIGALFAAFRARGLEPHPAGVEGDAQFAGMLARLAQGGWRVQLDPDQPTGEEDVEPDPVFGVSEGMFPREGVAGDDVGIFGAFTQMIGDVRAMGAGRIRRVKWCDIYWGSVYPVSGPSASGKGTPDPSFQYGERVPPPGDLLDGLRANNYDVLTYLGAFLIACHTAGIKVTLTPFHSGGGSPLSLNINDNDDPNADIDAPAGLSWRNIVEARPSHQKGVRLPSYEGWHRWYWDHSGGTESEMRFQKYCIQVWPTREAEDPASTAYERECARRKSLGIAAFCTGVAEYLAIVDEALRAETGGEGTLYDVVEFIELGNELDGLFVLPPTTDIDGEPSDDEERDARNGAMEAGRYMALLAGPFKRRFPEMRFRASELLSSKPVDGRMIGLRDCEWEDVADLRRAWLAAVLKIGMEAETTLWREYQAALVYVAATLGLGSVPDYVVEWVDTCESAGFYWPPAPTTSEGTLGLRARDLVHEVGFHWYHGYNVEVTAGDDTEIPIVKRGSFLYFDAERLAADVASMRSEVVEVLAREGFVLTISIGEIGFAAAWPDGTDRMEVRKAYYAGADELLQGAMLLRLIAVARLAGVSHLYWFCHYLKPLQAPDGTPESWTGEVLASGLHNDVRLSGVPYLQFAREGAYCRPAWYTFRRLTWLLGNTRTVGARLYTNERGLTALRFRMRTPLTQGPDGLPFGSPISGTTVSYEYAWILWLDQYSDDKCHHPEGDGLGAPVSIHLYDTGGLGYRLLSVVPYVREEAGADANGYRASTPVWQYDRKDLDPTAANDLFDPLWRRAIGTVYGERENARGISYVSFTLEQANAFYAPTPICVLTNASELSFS